MNSADVNVARLVDSLVEQILKAAGSRCLAVYQMGSLARGGFSPATSDIDIGVIVASPSTVADGSVLNAAAGEVAARHPEITNPISIFWGSVEDLNGDTDAGRYPPFDRMDLIDHARLLAGTEMRERLVRPSATELVEATAAFALELVLSEKLLAFLEAPERLTASGIRNVTKFCLFPARFVYLLDTGCVAGNAESAQHALNQLSGPAGCLVESAHLWRSELPADAVVTEQLTDGLRPLYCWFLDRYCAALADGSELRTALETWRQRLG